MAPHASRGIHGPTRLSRHPCRSSPFATIPLGLLKGRGRCPTASAILQAITMQQDCFVTSGASHPSPLQGEGAGVRGSRLARKLGTPFLACHFNVSAD
ncbi:hypothetical protein E8F06_22005 [Pseudomonas sp. BN411]|nr:hypothetical protein [Pseudomonas sp. BN411]